MKTVGVITLCNSTNFGGVLQAVALHYALNKVGKDAVMIVYQKPTTAWNSVKEYLYLRKKYYGVDILRMAGGSFMTLLKNIHYFEKKKKIASFDDFRKEHLIMTQYFPCFQDLKGIGNRYDAYITGSDQVWNAEFTDGVLDPAYLLEFVDPGIAKYSYAASAGGLKSEDYLLDLLEKIKDFKGISIREQSLAERLKKLSAYKIKCHLDPVFLLSKEEWQAMEKEPSHYLPPNYILNYYLDQNAEKDIILNNISDILKLPIVDINPSGLFLNKKRICNRSAGPGEFLYYIEHADYVVTDSFHAVAFSLIFQTNFIACNREGQESRIKDLLKKVELDNHLVSEHSGWQSLFESFHAFEKYFGKEVEEAYRYLNSI